MSHLAGHPRLRDCPSPIPLPARNKRVDSPLDSVADCQSRPTRVSSCKYLVSLRRFRHQRLRLRKVLGALQQFSVDLGTRRQCRHLRCFPRRPHAFRLRTPTAGVFRRCSGSSRRLRSLRHPHRRPAPVSRLATSTKCSCRRIVAIRCRRLRQNWEGIGRRRLRPRERREDSRRCSVAASHRPLRPIQ